MKRKRNFAMIAGLFIVLIFLAWYILFYCGFAYRQKLIATSTSPNQSYTIRAYTYNFGAAAAPAVLCRITNNKSGETRDLYRCSRCDTADIIWLNPVTARINGVALDAEKDTYSGDSKRYGSANEPVLLSRREELR